MNRLTKFVVAPALGRSFLTSSTVSIARISPGPGAAVGLDLDWLLPNSSSRPMADASGLKASLDKAVPST